MFATSAEQIQKRIIKDLHKKSILSQSALQQNNNMSRQSITTNLPLTFRRGDHQIDCFYQVADSQDYKYRRNLDQQKTEISYLSKNAQKISNDMSLDISSIKQSKSLHYNVSDSRGYNTSFHKQTELQIKKKNSQSLMNEKCVLKSHRANSPEIAFSQNNTEMRSAYSKSPIGAITNKLYNSKILQYPEKDNSNFVNLQIKGVKQIDELGIKRILAQEGIQVISLELPHQPITNVLDHSGNLKIRIDKDKHLTRVVQSLQTHGLSSNIVKEQHPIKTQKSQKTWIKQKIAYKNMGFFSNRDYDKLQVVKSNKQDNEISNQQQRLEANNNKKLNSPKKSLPVQRTLFMKSKY